MPELAELATYAKDISNKIDGSKLVMVKAYNTHKKLTPPPVFDFFNSRVNHKLYCLSLAKSLLFTDFNYSVEFKLGMTGGFTVTPSEKHTYWAFEFGNGFSLYHQDPRKFGSVNLRKCNNDGFEMALGGYGLGKFELLSYYKKHIKESDSPRISWLLNKGPKTGVGNYMANEALGRLDLNPFKPFSSIREMIATLEECKKVASESFELGGYSFGGGYYTLNGDKGKFQGRFYKSQQIKKQTFKGRPVYSKYLEKYEQ